MPSHYRDLFAWRKAMDLSRLAFQLAARLPPDAGPLVDELRDSALAVPARIAAGHRSDQLRRWRRAIDAANGKVARVECLLLVAERLGLVTPDDPEVVKLRELCAELGRTLSVLMTTARQRDADSAS